MKMNQKQKGLYGNTVTYTNKLEGPNQMKKTKRTQTSKADSTRSRKSEGIFNKRKYGGSNQKDPSNVNIQAKVILLMKSSH